MSIVHDFNNWRRGNGADNFGCLLFHLIAKADPGNRARLRVAFPQHVELYERWQNYLRDIQPNEIAAYAREWGIRDE